MGMNVKFGGTASSTTIAIFTAAETGNTFKMPSLYTTFQVTANDAGGDITVGEVTIEVSNDESVWITMGTISVTTNGTTDGFAANAAWRYVRARCTTLTETGSTPNVTVTMGG